LIRRVLLLCALLIPASLLAANTLNGAGATFPYPIYSKWFSEYHKLHPDVQINYQSIGSGGGIQQLKAGTVDFGASDMPLNDEQLKEMKGPIFQLPTVLGADVPAYNLSGISTELRFTPQTLADIFLGKITKWNDKALAAANPGVALPDKPIIVVHRSDGSGTTFVWTDYLGAKGNEGVAGLIRQSDGALGYIELIYALQNKIPFGSVQNAAGNFVKASLQSTTAAAASVKEMPDDFRVSITNAAGKDAYPISSFTWLLVPVKWNDGAKAKIMVDFLHWMIDKGQAMAEQLDYAPLPKSVASKERAKIKQIQ
jgi:phosphate transport system substrate-binding protein